MCIALGTLILQTYQWFLKWMILCCFELISRRSSRPKRYLLPNIATLILFTISYWLSLPRLAPLNRVYPVKFVYDSGAYFTGVPLRCSTRVKQPAGLPDEDRGFTGELSATCYQLIHTAFLLLTNQPHRHKLATIWINAVREEEILFDNYKNWSFPKKFL